LACPAPKDQIGAASLAKLMGSVDVISQVNQGCTTVVLMTGSTMRAGPGAPGVGRGHGITALTSRAMEIDITCTKQPHTFGSFKTQTATDWHYGSHYDICSTMFFQVFFQ